MNEWKNSKGNEKNELSSKFKPEPNVSMLLCMKNIMRSFYVNYYLTFVLHVLVLFVSSSSSLQLKPCLHTNEENKTHIEMRSLKKNRRHKVMWIEKERAKTKNEIKWNGGNHTRMLVGGIKV